MSARSDGVRCLLIRGGTSKGAYFVADDLPADPVDRDELLMRLLGTPDPRQIDGLGGAHPLTSKVAIVSRSSRSDVDLDYLFLQIGVEHATVSDRQNCGNLLAGVGQFALERGLIAVSEGQLHFAAVPIYMVNTDSIATAYFQIVDGMPNYSGGTRIDGVPGTAAEVRLEFDDIAGGSCGALLPTGNAVDTLDDLEVTLIDNGMPVVIVRASDLGKSGYETPDELETDQQLCQRIESIRRAAGPMMKLGDVADTTVPKITLVSAPINNGTINTRTFIPHRCHEAIGVFGAVSVATAALLPNSPAASVARLGGHPSRIVCEHPTGTFTVVIDATSRSDGTLTVHHAGIIRTARKLMDGICFPRDT